MIITLLEASNPARIPPDKYAFGESGDFFVNLLVLSGFYSEIYKFI